MGNSKRKDRYERIDEIRGLTLISMILYHFIWDLRFIAQFNIGWYTELPGKIWQMSICFTFIFVSGFCLHLSRNSLKRGFVVFVAGLIITIATLIFMPENRVIFGVLTLIGSCMIIVSLVAKFLKNSSNCYLLFLASLFLFVITFRIPYGEIRFFDFTYKLPDFLYSGYIMTYLGFPFRKFYSTDYFPLIPWIFLFTAGFVFYDIMNRRNLLDLLKGYSSKLLIFVGRHTLAIYMLHQIILYGITLIIMKMRHTI